MQKTFVFSFTCLVRIFFFKNKINTFKKVEAGSEAETAAPPPKKEKNWRVVRRAEQHEFKMALRRYTRWSKSNAPGGMWSRQLGQWAKDMALPGDGAAKLLQFLTDEVGATIANTLPDIKLKLQEHLRKVAQVTADLPAACEQNLSLALAMVGAVCQDATDPSNADYRADLDAQSVVSKVARDALAIWGDIDRRRHPGSAPRDLSVQQMRRDRASGSGAFTASATVKNAHGDKCEALNRDFTAAEVAEARKRIRDTGPGADGLEPVVLTGHDLLRACKCVDCGAAQAEMSGVSDEFSSEANPDPAPNADGGASSQCRRSAHYWSWPRCSMTSSGVASCQTPGGCIASFYTTKASKRTPIAWSRTDS